MSKCAGVYRVYNKVNGRSYIGSSTDMENALMKRHYKGKSSNVHLQHAIKKYGIENFSFEIMFITPDVRIARKMEQAYFDLYENSGLWHKLYNIAKKASNENFDERIIKKISRSMSGKNNPMYGRKHTQKSINLMKQNRRSVGAGDDNYMVRRKGTWTDYERARFSRQNKGLKEPNK